MEESVHCLVAIIQGLVFAMQSISPLPASTLGVGLCREELIESSHMGFTMCGYAPQSDGGSPINIKCTGVKILSNGFCAATPIFWCWIKQFVCILDMSLYQY